MARSAGAAPDSGRQGGPPGGAQRDAVRASHVPSAADWEPVVGLIGAKVRELRQQLGLSLQQLATRSDVSAAAIHKVERNDMVPTITTLLKLAAALGRPIGYFVDAPPGGVPVATFTPAAARTALAAPAPGIEPAGISGPAQRFRIRGSVVSIEPGAHSGPEVMQVGEELVLVLEGALDFEVAGERYTLQQGDALHFPTDCRRRWANTGSRPARAVWLVLPAG